ncbi:MAG: hypothetical protein ABL963_17670, partial [Longimicrobiales bacterium]
MDTRESLRNTVLDSAVGALFARAGTRVEASANTPLLLEDPDSVWLVAEGLVNVFAVEVVDGSPAGPRSFLFAVGAGGILVGVEPEWAGAVGLLAVGTSGAATVRAPSAALRAAAPEARAALDILLDDYVRAFSSAVSARGQPQADHLLAPGEG